MCKKQLNTLTDGEIGKIVKIRGEAALHRTLLAKGLFIGRRISIHAVDLNPMEDHIKVRVNGSFYSLAKEIAANIQVEVA